MDSKYILQFSFLMESNVDLPSYVCSVLEHWCRQRFVDHCDTDRLQHTGTKNKIRKLKQMYDPHIPTQACAM